MSTNQIDSTYPKHAQQKHQQCEVGAPENTKMGMMDALFTEILTCCLMKPINGLMIMPTEELPVTKGTRYIQRLFPESVAILTNTSYLWSAGNTASS